MALDFPNSPSVGQTFTVSNVVWTWDGVKWVASGIAGAPFMPLNGVTDGSNAPAGQIGEVISTSTTGSNVTSATPGTLGSITLSPGDWDVDASATINSTGAAAVNYIVASLGPTVNSNVGFFTSSAILPAAGSVAQVLPISHVRMNVTVSTLVNVTVQCNFTGSPCTCSGKIWARRAR